jgi:hypothetical protein
MPTLRRLPSSNPLRLMSKDSIQKIIKTEKNGSEASPIKFTEKIKDVDTKSIHRASTFTVSEFTGDLVNNQIE